MYSNMLSNIYNSFITPMFLPCCPKTDKRLTLRPLPANCAQRLSSVSV